MEFHKFIFFKVFFNLKPLFTRVQLQFYSYKYINYLSVNYIRQHAEYYNHSRHNNRKKHLESMHYVKKLDHVLSKAVRLFLITAVYFCLDFFRVQE